MLSVGASGLLDEKKTTKLTFQICNISRANVVSIKHQMENNGEYEDPKLSPRVRKIFYGNFNPAEVLENSFINAYSGQITFNLLVYSEAMNKKNNIWLLLDLHWMYEHEPGDPEVSDKDYIQVELSTPIIIRVPRNHSNAYKYYHNQENNILFIGDTEDQRNIAKAAMLYNQGKTEEKENFPLAALDNFVTASNFLDKVVNKTLINPWCLKIKTRKRNVHMAFAKENFQEHFTLLENFRVEDAKSEDFTAIASKLKTVEQNLGDAIKCLDGKEHATLSTSLNLAKTAWQEYSDGLGQKIDFQVSHVKAMNSCDTYDLTNAKKEGEKIKEHFNLSVTNWDQCNEQLKGVQINIKPKSRDKYTQAHDTAVNQYENFRRQFKAKCGFW